MFRKLIPSERKQLCSAIFVTASLGFFLFIYCPTDLFINNRSEFWFDLKDVISNSAILFLLYFVVFIFISWFLVTGNPYAGYINIFIRFSLLISVVLQGVLFSSDVRPLDGDIFSSDSIVGITHSVLAFGLVPVFLLLLFWIIKKERFIAFSKSISIILFVFLVLTLLFSVMMHDDVLSNNETLICTDTGEFEFSDDSNFIVLMLDTIDSDYFTECLYDKHSEELSGAFKDFTLYNDVLAAYPYTSLAVPQVLTGRWYEGDMSIHEYLNTYLQASPFFSELVNQNYKLSLYDAEISFDRVSYEGYFENQVVADIHPSNIIDFTPLLLKMAGIRFLPWSLKESCYNIPYYSSRIKTDEISQKYNTRSFSCDDLLFYNHINSAKIAEKTTDKRFKFIHLEGAHPPYDLDADMTKKVYTSYDDKVEASLILCKAYIDFLKENNFYDNSAIIIMADHGYSKKESADNFPLESRMHPLFMVKGTNACNKSLCINSQALSYENISSIFLQSLQDNYEYPASSNDRQCYLFQLGREDIIDEYIVTGSVTDFLGFTKTGNSIYPEKVK